MRISNKKAQQAYEILTKWVAQDGEGSFPFLEKEITKEEVTAEVLENHFLLRKLPPAMLDAMERVVHTAAMGLLLSLTTAKDQNEYLKRHGEAIGMKRAIDGIRRIANINPESLKKGLKKR